ncbi:MAG: lipid-A-disaccharide synthase [Candidatus Omnitrophica bacterium]|nr:lipid-A-disaccharide synthase [Candidatus Omnitrophota bacterium]
MNRKVLIIAGEPSGDLHGSLLVKALAIRDSSMRFTGIGGERMRACGVRLIHDISQLSIVGFGDVIPKLALFRKILKEIDRLLAQEVFDLVILIDYPGLNLKIARIAKGRRVRVVYYITPQIWAWGLNRVHLIKKYVDLALVIFRFEEGLFRKEGIPVHFVGHPLLDVMRQHTALPRDSILEQCHVTNAHPIIALLPGSRNSEVKSHLPIMLKAAQILKEKFRDAAFIVIKSDYVDGTLYEAYISDGPAHHAVTYLGGRNYDVLGVADFAVVCSGTATLEAALSRVPMVVVYKTSLINWLIARRMIRIPRIALVNVIAERHIVPELLQENATGRKIADVAYAILSQPKRHDRMQSELGVLTNILGIPGASDRAANHICDLLNPS